MADPSRDKLSWYSSVATIVGLPVAVVGVVVSLAQKESRAFFGLSTEPAGGNASIQPLTATSTQDRGRVFEKPTSPVQLSADSPANRSIDLTRANQLSNACYELYWRYTRQHAGTLDEAKRTCEAGLRLVGDEPSFQKGALWFNLGLLEEQAGDELAARGDLPSAQRKWALAESNFRSSLAGRADLQGQAKTQERIAAVERKCGGGCAPP